MFAVVLLLALLISCSMTAFASESDTVTDTPDIRINWQPVNGSRDVYISYNKSTINNVTYYQSDPLKVSGVCYDVYVGVEFRFYNFQSTKVTCGSFYTNSTVTASPYDGMPVDNVTLVDYESSSPYSGAYWYNGKVYFYGSVPGEVASSSTYTFTYNLHFQIQYHFTSAQMPSSVQGNVNVAMQSPDAIVSNMDYRFWQCNSLIYDQMEAVLDWLEIQNIWLKTIQLTIDNEMTAMKNGFAGVNSNILVVNDNISSLRSENASGFNRVEQAIHDMDDYVNSGDSSSLDQAVVNNNTVLSNHNQQEDQLLQEANANLDHVDLDVSLLSTYKTSTDFWLTAVTRLSTDTGGFWSIIVFSLLMGLIFFILRLRQ